MKMPKALSAIVRPRTGRPDPNDDAFFGADRDFSIDAGLRARIDFPQLLSPLNTPR